MFLKRSPKPSLRKAGIVPWCSGRISGAEAEPLSLPVVNDYISDGNGLYSFT